MDLKDLFPVWKQLTEAQQEFFKDSKAVDGEGRLLTLYHGCLLYTSPSPRDRG